MYVWVVTVVKSLFRVAQVTQVKQKSLPRLGFSPAHLSCLSLRNIQQMFRWTNCSLWLIAQTAMNLNSILMRFSDCGTARSVHTVLIVSYLQEYLQLPKLKTLQLRLQHTSSMKTIEVLPLEASNKLKHVSVSLPVEHCADKVSMFFMNSGIHWADIVKLECSNAPPAILEDAILSHLVNVREISLHLQIFAVHDECKALMLHLKDLER